MSRAIALIIGIPLVIFLGYLAWQTGKHYLENLRGKDFVTVAILAERDRLLKEVTKHILDSTGSGGVVDPEIYVKFQNLKEATTAPQIEFATAELREVYEKEKTQMERVWRLLEEQ